MKTVSRGHGVLVWYVLLTVKGVPPSP